MSKRLSSLRIFPIAPNAKVPVRASPGAVGYDVFAYDVLDRHTKEHIADLPVAIKPREAALISIGVIMAVPFPYEVQVRPRSGLASKFDIELSNSPGTVDPDFRGIVGCLLRNRGKNPFVVEPGMRIAQLVFNKVEIPDLVVVGSIDELGATPRGTGGFGSTGLMGEGLGTEAYDQEQLRWDVYFMNIALQTAAMSNCIRDCPRYKNGRVKRNRRGEFVGQVRRYGCVIAKNDQVIASGYNCQCKGSELCEEVGCLRDELNIDSGTRIEICRAVHAEQKALAAAANRGISVEDASLYVNAEPCLFCARQIAELELDAVIVLGGGYGKTHGLHVIQKAGIRIRVLPKEFLSSRRR